jgi:hypothetical protein
MTTAVMKDIVTRSVGWRSTRTPIIIVPPPHRAVQRRSESARARWTDQPMLSRGGRGFELPKPAGSASTACSTYWLRKDTTARVNSGFIASDLTYWRMR